MTDTHAQASDPTSDAAGDTAASLAAAVRDGRVTARSLTDQALARIARHDGRIGAFQLVREDRARAEADAIDSRADRSRLPLAGVPIAVKDAVPVAGEPMRNGTAASPDEPQAADHPVVHRLREAGAVIVGLTRVPELCVFGTTDSTFGTTRNPWGTDHSTGGSSGGSAAAVASGMVPIAHGTDGMGSIRIPAACCGLVGLKPGLGLMPAELGEGSWFDMAENGPLTTTVADAALMLSVMAAQPELATPAEPQRLRIAVSTRVPGFLPLDRAWKDAATTTGALLREAGHDVATAHPAYDPRLLLTEVARWTAGTTRDAEQLPDPSLLEPRVRRHAAVGRTMRKFGLAGEKGRTAWQERAERLFADHDVLVTPALAQDPRKAVRWSERGWLANVAGNAYYAPFAAPWNVAGWPAMTVPAGVSPRGLPVAVQLVGRPGSEATLLGVAAQIERIRPWARVAPGFSD